MGGKYSRGPVISQLDPFVHATRWKTFHNMYDEFIEKTMSSLFISQDMFAKLFTPLYVPITSDLDLETLLDPENAQTGESKPAHVSSAELAKAFLAFDPAEKGRASAIDIFGGLALILDAPLIAKFKFLFALLDRSHQGQLNHSEYVLLLLCCSRGLAAYKHLSTPPEKLIRSIVDRIFKRAYEQLAEEAEDEQHLGRNAIDITSTNELPCALFMEVARQLPEVIYYMYDLNADKAVNIESILQQQCDFLQDLSTTEAKIHHLEMLHPEFALQYREVAAAPLSSEAKWNLERKLIAREERKKQGKSVASLQRLSTEEQTEHFIKQLNVELQLLLDKRLGIDASDDPKAIARKQKQTPSLGIRLATPLALVELVEKASDYTVILPLQDAIDAHTNFPRDQLDLILPRSIVLWFKQWRGSQTSSASKKKPSSSTSASLHHEPQDSGLWLYVVDLIQAEITKCRTFWQKLTKDLHWRKLRKDQWLLDHPECLIELPDDEEEERDEDNDQQQQAQCHLELKTKEYDPHSKASGIDISFKQIHQHSSTSAGLLNELHDDAEYHHEDWSVKKLEKGMHSGIQIQFLLLASRSNDEIQDLVNKVTSFLNNPLLLDQFREIYGGAEVEIFPFVRNLETEIDYVNKKQYFDIFVMFPVDFNELIQNHFHFMIEKLVQDLHITLEFDRTLQEYWDQAKAYENRLPAELLDEIFMQFDLNQDGHLDFYELNRLQQALGQRTASKATIYRIFQQLGCATRSLPKALFQQTYPSATAILVDAKELGLGIFSKLIQGSIKVIGTLNTAALSYLEGFLECDEPNRHSFVRKAATVLVHAMRSMKWRLVVEEFQEAFDCSQANYPVVKAFLRSIQSVADSINLKLQKQNPKQTAKQLKQQEAIQKGLMAQQYLLHDCSGLYQMRLYSNQTYLQFQFDGFTYATPTSSSSESSD